MKKTLVACITTAFLLAVIPVKGRGAISPPEISPNIPSGQPVGTAVIWTLTNQGGENIEYRFTISLPDSPADIMYDYSDNIIFTWVPIDEGAYTVTASARDPSTGETSEASDNFDILPLATTSPVVSSTDHPLIAIYSAPPCPVGNRMHVFFKPVGGGFPMITGLKQCLADKSINFYVTGMLAEKTYIIRHQIVDGNNTGIAVGPVLIHETGALPITFPVIMFTDPREDNVSRKEKVVLYAPLILDGSPRLLPFAVDIIGRVIWYDNRSINEAPFLTQPVAGGTMLRILNRHSIVGYVVQETDLAGHIIRETTAPRVYEQIQAMGHTDILTGFHHEARRLPSGHTLILAYSERIVEDLQGPGTVNVLGNYIVDLDEDWQVAWVWNSFDHLDVGRPAVLGEVCVDSGPGCPTLFLDTVANDWLHSNSIAYSGVDGNLIVSIRHQDWVVKIDYQDGAGTGSVLWRLGAGGDFTVISSDPYPYQSHQHDANIVSNDADQIVLFDNGNTRCRYLPQPCNSRGQVFAIDENTMTATLVLNTDLGAYSSGLGGSHPLPNGNFHFTAGIEAGGASTSVTAHETGPDGTVVYSQHLDNSAAYRSFRMKDLYSPPGTGIAVPAIP